MDCANGEAEQQQQFCGLSRAVLDGLCGLLLSENVVDSLEDEGEKEEAGVTGDRKTKSSGEMVEEGGDCN